MDTRTVSMAGSEVIVRILAFLLNKGRKLFTVFHEMCGAGTGLVVSDLPFPLPPPCSFDLLPLGPWRHPRSFTRKPLIPLQYIPPPSGSCFLLPKARQAAASDPVGGLREGAPIGPVLSHHVLSSPQGRTAREGCWNWRPLVAGELFSVAWATFS